MSKMIFGIDFDGTIVKHTYPTIGEELPGAMKTIKDLQANGHKIILFTMRSGKELEEAVKFLQGQGVILFGVNENPQQKSWTTSPKPYCHVYIDDAALGCPLIHPLNGDRAEVNWQLVRAHLKQMGALWES